MASLMKKLCDTMPLAGALGASGGLARATVGKFSRRVRVHQNLGAIQVSCARPAGDPKKDTTPIWGYEVSDAKSVKRITCRVAEDKYNNYLVLEELEWGFAPQSSPGSFRHAIRIAVDANRTIELPFAEEARLMTFTTQDGENPPDEHSLWPLKAKHDPSIVHVFVFDISMGDGKAVALKEEGHPDAPKVRKLLKKLEDLNRADPDDESDLEEFLFDDNLWEEDYTNTPPSGTVPENVDLSFTPVRVVVATSLTVCKERADYQPGQPAGVGRLFPHVMVVANADLLWVDAGVRVKRPKKMTLLDAEKCGCGEMLGDIGGILVADSNANAMIQPEDPAMDAPMPFWANLFNYYVVDPFREPSLAAKLIPLVSPGQNRNRDAGGFVDRDCSDVWLLPQKKNQERVTKKERQGQFDNIHLAPKMIVRDRIERVEGPGGVMVPFTTPAEWKMDSVTMAPFCAHDCFHMHWRWTDNANTERATFGWGPKSPYKVAGAPMVPLNQKVGLYLFADCGFSYLAQAEGPRHNEWQPFCHHGGGYALTIGSKISAAKLVVPVMLWAHGARFRRREPGNKYVMVYGDWALFYWRLRYAVKVLEKQTANGVEKTLEVVERFKFKDKAAALKL